LPIFYILAAAFVVHLSSVVLETAKIHELEPYAYLNAMFKALPYADTVEKIEDLLPCNFKKSKPSWLPRTFNSAYCELLHHDKDIYIWKVRRFIERLRSREFPLVRQRVLLRPSWLCHRNGSWLNLNG
jgi:hypothetical protein